MSMRNVMAGLQCSDGDPRLGSCRYGSCPVRQRHGGRLRPLLFSSGALAAVVAGGLAPAVAQITATNPPAASLPAAVTQGIPATPLPVQGANNSNNFSAALGKPGVANPVPGSIVVRLNATVRFYVAAESSSLDTTKGVGPANTGAAKLNPYTTLGFMRLYFGMDGMATNGLRYGAAIEVRQNFGAATGSTANNQSSASTTGSTLFVRRAFGYLAGDQWGIVRFGQGDSPVGIFDNGVTTFQNFDGGGGWNGDVPGAIPGNAQPTFPFLSQAGADYGSSKIVYLSPQYAGFDFGVSFAPNNAALQDGNCSFAATGCYNLSSSSVASDGARFTNMYVVGARYQGIFGPVGVYAMADYYGSGHVQYTSTAPFSQFDGLSVADFGLAVTYAGFTIGGHGTTGTYNGQGALRPKGGVNGNAWLVGVQYATGPATVGASFYNFQSQGSPSLVNISQRNENALAVGFTYGIAPGLAIWGSYLYGTRHQGNFDFQTGTVGGAYNDVKSQAFGVGTIVKW